VAPGVNTATGEFWGLRGEAAAADGVPCAAVPVVIAPPLSAPLVPEEEGSRRGKTDGEAEDNGDGVLAGRGGAVTAAAVVVVVVVVMATGKRRGTARAN